MKRVLLKLSGEALGAKGFEPEKVEFFAEEIKKASKKSQVAVVLGAGNIWRGRDSQAFAFNAAESDYIGMTATFLNAMVMKNALNKKSIKARIFSPIEFDLAAEKLSRRQEIEALEKGEVVIFAGGTGSPFFTTDSAAALRAIEIGAEIILKATKVDGVYDSDPSKNSGAKRYAQVSFIEAMEKKLEIFDQTAFDLAAKNNIPIFVFNAFADNSISEAIEQKNRGTLVS